MNAVRRFVVIVNQVNEKVGSLVLYLIPVLILTVTLEVVLRYVFNKPTIWGLETTQFIFCASIALTGGYTLLNGKHVSVDMFYNKWKPRGKAIANIITSPILLFFIGILLKISVESTIDAIRYMERAAGYWKPPLFPIYTIITIGVALIFFQALARFLNDIITAVTGVPLVSEPKEEAK